MKIEKAAEIGFCTGVKRAINILERAAVELAERVGLMLVVGSRSSANTQRLAKICSAVVETHHIERAQEIDPPRLRNHRPQYIGVTAGASTPEEAIEEVMALLKDTVR